MINLMKKIKQGIEQKSNQVKLDEEMGGEWGIMESSKYQTLYLVPS